MQPTQPFRRLDAGVGRWHGGDSSSWSTDMDLSARSNKLAWIVVAGVLMACGADDASTDTGAADVASDTGSADVVSDAGTDTLAADASADPSSDVSVDATEDVAVDVATDGAEAVSVLDFDPREPGPWAPGYRSWAHTYTVPGTGEERTILVNVWYPTDVTDGERPRYDGIFVDDFSVVDAPAVPPVGAAYPVHVHSHGHRGFGGDSAFLMRHLASHGWVAVAPDHVGDLFSAYPRSELMAHYIERASDVSQVLDALEALNDEDPLSLADTSRVTMTGHSRGTWTVWASLGATFDTDRLSGTFADESPEMLAVFGLGFDDPRIVGGVPMAGTYRASWFGDGWRSVDEPVMAMTGSRDGADSTADGLAQFERIQLDEFFWLEFEGGCHQTFALGSCGYLDVALGYDLITDYVTAFARVHVAGDTDPDVVLTARGQVELDPVIRAMTAADR
jgi:predicted dienelactone hydrolase